MGEGLGPGGGERGYANGIRNPPPPQKKRELGEGGRKGAPGGGDGRGVLIFNFDFLIFLRRGIMG